MSATRTQVYLTPEQRRRIDQISAAEGVTMADVVRRALDRYLASEFPDPSDAFESTFGAVPDLVTPDRGEWDRG